MEEAEFVRRVENMTNRLYRVCRTVLSRDADCQDAAQEAVVQAWLHVRQLRDETKFEAWLMRIAVNECRKLYRRERPHVVLEEETAQAPCPERGLWELLTGMDEKYALPLELYYVEQYKVREIARILRLPEGTVKRRLYAGREQIRETLGGEENA